MMEPVHRIDGSCADPCAGRVVVDWPKTLWNGVMIVGSVAALFHVTPGALIVFAVLTYATLLLGQSIGMHRLVIHRSFETHPVLEAVLVWLGVLVGAGGPSRVIRVHDIRDWAQRAPDCHDVFAHRRGYLRDISWQLFYRFEFDRPPRVTIEQRPLMAHFDRHWRTHQLALAAILFAMGGLPWVLWGVCARVLISAVAHWSAIYLCHAPMGPAHARHAVFGAGVQASDLRVDPADAWLAGLLTHGECWHSNHHAFPESARIGLERGQPDPAARVIEALERLGWVWNVRGPRPEGERSDLLPLHLGQPPAAMEMQAVRPPVEAGRAAKGRRRHAVEHGHAEGPAVAGRGDGEAHPLLP